MCHLAQAPWSTVVSSGAAGLAWKGTGKALPVGTLGKGESVSAIGIPDGMAQLPCRQKLLTLPTTPADGWRGGSRGKFCRQFFVRNGQRDHMISQFLHKNPNPFHIHSPLVCPLLPLLSCALSSCNKKASQRRYPPGTRRAIRCVHQCIPKSRAKPGIKREENKQQEGKGKRVRNKTQSKLTANKNNVPHRMPKPPLYLCTLPRNGKSNRKQGRHKKQHYHHANHHGSAELTRRQGSHQRQGWA